MLCQRGQQILYGVKVGHRSIVPPSRLPILWPNQPLDGTGGQTIVHSPRYSIDLRIDCAHVSAEAEMLLMEWAT